MINIGITWYFGRALNDIRNVEEKLRAKEDANMLRDMRALNYINFGLNMIYSTLKIDPYNFSCNVASGTRHRYC
jgi:hypothetical protein